MAALGACFPSFDGLSGGGEPVLGPRDGGDSSTKDAGDVLDASEVDVVPGPDGAPPLPVSCRDARDRGFRTVDGDVEIDVDGLGPAKPFVVTCTGLGDVTAEAKEYLPLVNTTNPLDA